MSTAIFIAASIGGEAGTGPRRGGAGTGPDDGAEVADRPYDELIAAVIHVANTMYRRRGGGLPPHPPR